ncbi:tetratricopeptide repeat protein [Hymenobacter sp. BT491]|uniref:tetratricopeptide repeat protein n=1 Tax=Hymenobacter sp. BT491 TaxID=2766779 RepID=UPI0016536BFA|nr:tetratricopeptide repeat protein [Hymenobacter sp. BT491]MBC6991798.1 hypothetical protein [Hymenobacter sp. BT491]
MRCFVSLSAGLLLMANTVWGQTNMAVLRKADDLVAEKKYESAFKLLNDYDPKNAQPAVALKKEEIVLNYSIASSNYRSFTFKDLSTLESLEENQEHEAPGTRYRFRVRAVLDSLKQKYPDNYKLDRGLGDYYYAVQQCDCAEKKKTEDELFPLMIKHYEEAHKHAYGDYKSYFVVGYAKQRLGQFKQSVPYFLHSIELKKDFPTAHLNLAFVYLELKQYEKARTEAQLAVDQFPDEAHKSDASFLLSKIEERIKTQKELLAAKKTGKKTSKTKKPATAKATPAKNTATPEPKPAETKAAEAKSAEATPADAKPAEAKPN